MKKVSGGLRLELSQFRSLEAFAQFGSDLDADTQKTLARGTRLVQALNQGELKPLSVAEQVVSVYAGTGGSLDRIKADRVQEFLDFAIARFHAEQADLLTRLDNSDWGDDIEEQLGKTLAEAIDDFGPDFDEEGLALEEGESERVIESGASAVATDSEEVAAAATS
jgi:F-type H+-transporting ATPase subunit alpha